MSLKPRITVEDGYVDGLTCAICESPDLSVVHVNNYPDFVSCGNCASAFVVEDEGSWIMYGKINADLPETSEFALRQWTWLDAVRQRTLDEREKEHIKTPDEQVPPSPEKTEEILTPVVDEIGEPAVESSTLDEIEVKLEPPVEMEPIDLSDRIDALIPDEIPSPEPEPVAQEEPSFDELFSEAEEFTVPDDIPLHLDQPEAEIPSEDIALGEIDELQLNRLEQVTAPTEEIVADPSDDMPLEEVLEDVLPSESDLPIDDLMPEAEGLPVPDWLEKDVPPEPELGSDASPIDEIISEEPESTELHSVPPFVDKEPEIPSAPIDEATAQAEADLSANTEPAEFLDLLKEETPPPDLFAADLPEFPASEAESGELPVSETVEEILGLEEVEEPIDEHLLPPWARHEGFKEEPPKKEAAAEPIKPADEPVIPEMKASVPPPIQVEEDSEEVVGAISGEAEVKPPPIHEPELPPGEPEQGFRHRVTVKGDKLTFPHNVCAHCLRMPVSLAAAVRGTLPDPTQPASRKSQIFKLPLCKECETRAQASTDEERSAKTQAYLISGAVAVILLVIVIISGLAPFKSSAIEGTMVLLITGVIGFVAPTLFLLNRASKFPPPYDAAYVLTTLRVTDDAGEGTTAFEWRNHGYAELFRQVNRRNAEDTIAKVEDLMLLTEPVTEPTPVESEEGITDKDFEEMIADADPSIAEPGEFLVEDESAKVESLEQAFLEAEPPEEDSQKPA
jgi:hypothetical protein